MRNGRPTSPVQRAREKHVQRVMRDGTTGRVMGDVVDLNVALEDLDDGGVDIKETLPASFLSALLDDGHDVRWRGVDASTLDLHLEKEAGFIRVKGTGRFSLQHPCVRCLNDVPFDVPLTLDLRLVAREKPLSLDDEQEEEGFADDVIGLAEPTDLEDLDVASYSDGIVALADTLREQLFLELPMHPACDSQRARPKAACAFEAPKPDPGWVDPRWAGLAALRAKLPAAPGATPPAAAAPAPASPGPTAAPAGKQSTSARPSAPAAKKPVRKKAAPKKPAPKAAAKKKAAAKAPAKKAAPARRKKAPR